MAIWKQTLNLMDVFTSVQDEEISPREGLEKILSRFVALKPYEDEYVEGERQHLIEEIEMIIDDDNDFEDVDYVLNELYDFGDIKISGEFFDAVKACWIKTRF